MSRMYAEYAKFKMAFHTQLYKKIIFVALTNRLISNGFHKDDLLVKQVLGTNNLTSFCVFLSSYLFNGFQELR